MNTYAIPALILLNLMSALDLYRSGKIGLALTFFCYAVANVGLLVESRRSGV